MWLLCLISVTSCQDAETIKRQAYLSEGRRLYEQKCANCHQKEGTGLRKLIPPLANADYLKNQRKQLACIIKYGLTGAILVNGQSYSLSMPANDGLSDRHIAQILTYVTHQWAGETQRWKDEEVKEMTEKCQTKP